MTMTDFWECVIMQWDKGDSEPHEIIRKAFDSEQAAKTFCENENHRIFSTNLPIAWKIDHHGGFDSADKQCYIRYFVYPRTIFPIEFA